MISRHVGRALAILLLLVPLVPTAARSQPPTSQESRALAEAEIRLERRLLARDLAAYSQARGAEQRERGRFDAAAGRLDQILTSGNLTIAGFEGLENEVRAAADSSRSASERVAELGSGRGSGCGGSALSRRTSPGGRPAMTR